MAKLLVIDDNETVREGIVAVCERMGHDVEEADSGNLGVEKLKAGLRPDLVLTDLKMDGLDGLGVLKAVKEEWPETAVVLITAHATIETAVEAIKSGAHDYVEKPVSIDRLRLKVERALEWRKLQDQNARLEATTEVLSGARDREVTGVRSFDGIIGESAPMQRIFRMIEKIAASDTNVHVYGESGTGKEVIASAVHEHSKRGSGPLIKVNCGAIPETLIESELFGHEKGAFTGAIKRKLGRFELADKGTIFLDEIAELPMSMQVKLLRVLQEKEIDRVGSEQSIKIDVRVISATNRDLKVEVEAGRFREDLFYRLHVVPLELPPLRERTDDIIPLARFFVDKLKKRTNSEVTRINDAAANHLLSYHYPGNVRELENTIERILALGTGDLITTAELPAQIRFSQPRGGQTIELPSEGLDLEAHLDHIRHQLMEQALARCDGVQTQAADMLQMSFRSFRYYAKKLGLTGTSSEEVTQPLPPSKLFES